MIDDLVKRMRVQKTIDEMTPDEVDKADFICGHEMCVLDGRIAADHIEALTAENERLRAEVKCWQAGYDAAVKRLADIATLQPAPVYIARAALGDTQ